MKILIQSTRIILLILGLSSASAFALPLPSNMIGLPSPEGQQLFMRSQYKGDYWPISRYMVMQKTLTYCGVATSTILLNALEVPAPVDRMLAPYHTFTQDNIFTDKVLKNITPGLVNFRGMTLDQWGALLKAFPISVKVVHADQLSEKQFRELAKKILNQKNVFIAINFSRQGLKEEGSGHISPIVAYDEKSDRLLLMDTARYKYSAAWVKTQELWNAMNTQDSDAKKTRGFVIVRQKAH